MQAMARSASACGGRGWLVACWHFMLPVVTTGTPGAPNLLLLTEECATVEPPLDTSSAAYFVPLRSIGGRGGGDGQAVGYRWAVVPEATEVTSLGRDGSVRWKVSVPHPRTTNVSVGGGFDVDSDGIPDLLLNYHALAYPATSCGRYAMGTSDFAILRGANGDVVALTGLLPAEEAADLCWDFREPSNPVQTKQCNETQHCVYPTQQWSASESPMWGATTPLLLFSPTYSQWLYALGWNATTSSMETRTKLKFPSCPLDSKHLNCAAPGTEEPYEDYTAAKPNAFFQHGETTGLCEAAPRGWKKCTINPHYGNGLLLNVGGSDRPDRALFFTSARVVQYSLPVDGGEFSPEQLIADYPFLTDNRTDIVGRDYGLVCQDPAAPHLVGAVFGDSVLNVLEDLQQRRDTCNVSGSLASEWANCSDAWGGIERHAALYDTTANTLEDRFFSLAHDPSRPVPFQLFENRTAYAALLHVPQQHVSTAPLASRLAFNVFAGGIWRVHVTEHGSLVDKTVIDGHILWDMRDLDGDGNAEWLTSPTDGYWPTYTTHLSHWDDTAAALQEPVQTVAGVPYLLGAEFRLPGRSLDDTSAATVSYNGSLHLLTYLRPVGSATSALELTPLATGGAAARAVE